MRKNCPIVIYKNTSTVSPRLHLVQKQNKTNLTIDCAHRLYPKSADQSIHILIVANSIEEHAELVMANGLELEEVKARGTTIPITMKKNPKTGLITRYTDREALEMLLMECKRLLAGGIPSEKVMVERAPPKIPDPFPDLRKKIIENACKCFPAGVATVIERDSGYRPVSREVLFLVSESMFDIALKPGPDRSWQASLVYGRQNLGVEVLKCALQGERSDTHHGAIYSLWKATVEQLHVFDKATRALAALPDSGGPASVETDFVRADSPMTDLQPLEKGSAQVLAEEQPAELDETMVEESPLAALQPLQKNATQEVMEEEPVRLDDPIRLDEPVVGTRLELPINASSSESSDEQMRISTIKSGDQVAGRMKGTSLGSNKTIPEAPNKASSDGGSFGSLRSFWADVERVPDMEFSEEDEEFYGQESEVRDEKLGDKKPGGTRDAPLIID